MAQRHGLHVAARIVTPRSPHREGLLPDAGQVAQQVFGVLALLVDVETHVVESRKGQHRQLVALRKACLDFRLPVDVVGQEGQPQQFEQQLQVGLADGKQISRLAADVPAAAQPHFRGAQRRFEGLLFGIAVAEPEVQHGTQRPGPVGGKSARIKTDFAHEVGVDDAHRTARRPLRGEMVDVRDFDPVHVELVLRRPAAAHDQIVAIPHGREGHAGIRAHDARHVAVRAGAFLDLPQAVVEPAVEEIEPGEPVAQTQNAPVGPRVPGPLFQALDQALVGALRRGEDLELEARSAEHGPVVLHRAFQHGAGKDAHLPGLAVFVPLEKVKLHFGTERKINAAFYGVICRGSEN